MKPAQLEKPDLRTLFLKQFVSALIIQSKPLPIPKKEKVDNSELHSLPIATVIYSKTQEPAIKQQFMLPKLAITPQKQLVAIPKPTIKQTAKQAPIQNELLNFGLETIAPIISDPAVLSVECPGPGKNIMVNRSGRMETTSLTLSNEQINNIMQSLSEKTKIPIMSGVFKTAFLNYIITAVVSEFVGTRFVIQKKMPQMALR